MPRNLPKLPKHIIIDMDPATFVAGFVILFFACIGVLYTIITPFTNY